MDRYPDLDGDGVDELLIGGTDFIWHGPTIWREGSVRIMSGATGQLIWILLEEDEPALRSRSATRKR